MANDTTDTETTLSQLYGFNKTTGTIDPADYADVEDIVKSDVCSALEIEADKVEMSTPMGRFLEWLTVFFTDVLGLNVQNANQLLVSAAAGQQLDAIAQWFQLERRSASYSTVTVTCHSNSDSDTTIPAGSTVINANGEYLESLEDAVIPAQGNANILFEAIAEGPIGVAAGTVNIIGTPISGWESCTNQNDGVLGSFIETDESLRARIMAARAVAPGFLQSIKNAVEAVVGNGSCMVLENNTSANLAVHGVDMEPHSILVCVDGLEKPTQPGYQDNDNVKAVAKAIFDNKPCGTGYTKTESIQDYTDEGSSKYQYKIDVADPFGNLYPVYFCCPIDMTISIVLQVQNRNYTGTDILGDVHKAVMSWAGETNFKSGENIYASDVIRAVESRVNGVVVVVCTVSEGGNDKGTSFAEIDAIHKASVDSEKVTVMQYSR